uniref:ATP synthase protein 8 n=1 Tax=Diddensiella santjacobensis TaxID=2704139 RepID=S5TMU9_9ASCO|nr:ATP synthase F0 subunit 8 [Diddensiella santjacobensis]AGS44140.1 ATP synthase F0 subunit 8 [Diddensiella santjacobensis]
MPQLLPFYHTNMVLWGFIVLGILTIIFSRIVLPRKSYIYLTRIFIQKL